MDFKEINSITQLANYLRCKPEFIEKVLSNDYLIIDKDEINELVNIDPIIIRKIYKKKKGKNNDFREVYAIYTHQLSNSLKILNNNLNHIYVPNKHIHGFVNGRSIRTNAYEHLGRKNLMSIDIQNFFESITDKMVSSTLNNIGFQKPIAEYISKLTTLNGRLVQGFNTSPTLANIVTHDMDLKLAKLCGPNVVYTRYADDLYFSTDDSLPCIKDLEIIINSLGFKLNISKTRIMRRGQSQYVTGLTIFDSDWPRIPKKVKRNLRLEIYYLRKFGYRKHAERRLSNEGWDLTDEAIKQRIELEMLDIEYRLVGWSHYIHSIEPVVGRKMYINLARAKK